MATRYYDFSNIPFTGIEDVTDQYTTTPPESYDYISSPDAAGYREYLSRGGTRNPVYESEFNQQGYAGENAYEYATRGLGDASTSRSIVSDFSRYTPYGIGSSNSSSSSSRGGSYSGRSTGTIFTVPNTPTGRTTTTTIIPPSGPKPTFGEVPKFEAPKWDEKRVRRLTQSKAAPGVRRLRKSVQQIASKYYENPNVRAMTLREALGGYGQGLQSVMAGAESAANAEEQRKYQTAYEAKALQYKADLQAKMAEFESALQDYMKQYTTKTVTKNTYGANTTQNNYGSYTTNKGTINWKAMPYL